MATRKNVPLPGSERSLVPSSTPKGPTRGQDTIEVRVTLKAKNSLKSKFDELAAQPVSERKYLTHEQLANQFGADDASIAAVEKFATEHHLSVRDIDKAQATVHLVGSVADMSSAFQTSLENYELPGGVTFRGRTGALHVPQELADVIESVNGLDDRPVAQPKLRVRPPMMPHAGPNIEYRPEDVAALYGFPQIANPGQGQTVAIIELGGGFRAADLKTYFGANAPSVTAVSVDKGKNTPTGDPNGPDGEVMLDIEVVGAIARNAKIAVYFAPNTNKGFLDAVGAAIHDTVRKPSVISISWGGPENGGGFTKATLDAWEQMAQMAGVLGITVLAASGDNGSSDGLKGDHVDVPAAIASITGCGGTRLVSADKKRVDSETVWNDGATGGATGGGMSVMVPLPAYQKGLQAALTAGGKLALGGRGVPDISANADPVTGYQVLVDGQQFVIGGTSAVAPLVAALIALLNQQLGHRVGFLNPVLYKLPGTPALRDVVSGNNGTYAAAPGWDACTGTGVPVGTALLAALKK